MRTTTANIVIVLTEDCQLRCSYCYIVGKNNFNRNSYATITKGIDILLNNEYMQEADNAVFSFIGGEPLIEIDLLSDVTEYILSKVKKTCHKWNGKIKFQITTNGLLYDSKKVQEYILLHHDILDINISIDGTKDKHNINRIFKNGEGSYDKVYSNVKLWVEQYKRTSTKMVISHEDLPFVAESAIHLLQTGLTFIDMNLVVEDTWHTGDDVVFEGQLMKLADYLIDNSIDSMEHLSLFKTNLFLPFRINGYANPCGDYNVTIGVDGRFYSCIRFQKYSLRTKKPRTIGNIYDGINSNLLRPFLSMDNNSVFSDRCKKCEFAKGCRWCAAENYDASDNGTLFQRTETVCSLHKSIVKVSRYYFRRLGLKYRV